MLKSDLNEIFLLLYIDKVVLNVTLKRLVIAYMIYLALACELMTKLYVSERPSLICSILFDIKEK